MKAERNCPHAPANGTLPAGAALAGVSPHAFAPAPLIVTASSATPEDRTPRTAAELLSLPVQYLKGIGPRRAHLLERLGLRTAVDVLFFFPRDYEDLTDLRPISEITEDAVVSVCGEIVDVDAKRIHGGRTRLAILISDGDDYLRGMWFNFPYSIERFRGGERILLSGKARSRDGRWEMTHPKITWLTSEDEEPRGRLLPIYPLTEGLQQGTIRRAMENLLPQAVELLDEVFPPEYLQQHALLPLKEALPEVHFPTSPETLSAARHRFVYQELFILQLALAVRRRQQEDRQTAPRLPAEGRIHARILRRFPFQLTAGQLQAIEEIGRDMGEPIPMRRLLQGDVGSGKTVVSVYAMLLAVAHGYQAVLMAPTEILARQHHSTLQSMLSGSNVRCELLTGNVTGGKRQQLLEQVRAGEVNILVGTQAIVHGEVNFAKLGLVVIDEQHKFGVRQRATLSQSGVDPHYLVMTATPIPRTMSLTIFGDLDVSTVRDRPAGRQPVHTYLATPEIQAKWWDFFRRKLREGRQGYVVTPLVEDQATTDETQAAQVRSLESAYESLTHGELADFRLDILHGRMSAEQKQSVMQDFREGRTQVLISTTVIEVGVDVPNATVMTIEGATRFGLSQLHQLRGRISRGTTPGYCCVFADTEAAENNARLEAFVQTNDGFELAEMDFQLRGPGDLLGTKQHGLPPLRIADLLRDAETLVEARRNALTLVESDPGLASERHARLRRMVLARYGQVLDLGEVG